MIRIKGLSTGYEKTIIIKDLNIEIKTQKITTIIGENGCGKSTLLKTIGRVINPMKGSVEVNGKDIHKTSTVEIARFLGLLPQTPNAPYGLTIEEIIEYGRFPHKKGRGILNNHDKEIIKWALEETNLYDIKDRSLETLSGGQRQRAWIALVLAQQTDIILLDEPTTYLDMLYQLEVLKLIQRLNKERKTTIVMVLHDINHASRFSDELIMLRKGKVVSQGPPKETMTNENLRKVFNIDATIIEEPKSQVLVCLTYDNI